VANPSPVRLFRVLAGCSHDILTLSPHYGGCFTHWVKASGIDPVTRKPRGSSKYCRPDGCPPDRHKCERYWKGFAACLLYRHADKIMEPIVLEITEHCELDLRGRWGRGQWWRLDHKAGAKGKHEPITARFLGQAPVDAVSPAFDFRAVLMHVFHEEAIDLGVANPLPPRVVMAAVPFSREMLPPKEQADVKKEGGRG
jgi:hypothetical protein